MAGIPGRMANEGPEKSSPSNAGAIGGRRRDFIRFDWGAGAAAGGAAAGPDGSDVGPTGGASAPGAASVGES